MKALLEGEQDPQTLADLSPSVGHFAHWSNWAMMSPFKRQRLPDHNVGQGIFRESAMASHLCRGVILTRDLSGL